MKKLSRKILRKMVVGGIATALILPVCYVGLSKLFSASAHQMQDFLQPEKVTYTMASIFNAKLRQNIQDFITDQTTQKSLIHFDPQAFYAELKKEFPIIKSLSWNFVPPKTIHFSIIGTTPLCRINNSFVIGNKHRLFDKQLFEEINPDSLPNIWINEAFIGEKLAPIAYRFAHKITKEQWATHRIYYYAPWNIHLVPYQSICHCRIVADEKSFFNAKKFDALDALFKDLCAQGLITKKMLQSQAIPLAFDFRIKNQIIVKFYEPVKGGRGS